MANGETLEYKYHKCVIAFDESYRRTGYAIVVDGKIKKLGSFDFQKAKCYNNPEKRIYIRKQVNKMLRLCVGKYGFENVAVVIERIRTFTLGDTLNTKYLKSVGALVASIVDTAYEYGVETWSADTRARKSAVLGTSKPQVTPFNGVKDPKKILDVKYIISLGFDEELKIFRGNGMRTFCRYDDDAADAACMGLYAFKKRNTLRRER